ncbi:5-formyltetrahydrofolate cyclo-ligase, partial [Klebsiella pneumoniae]
QELRTKLREARTNMDEASRTRENAAIIANVSYYIRSKQPKRIAAYVPVRTEPGGRLLLDALHAETSALILPVSLEDRRLDWA